MSAGFRFSAAAWQLKLSVLLSSDFSVEFDVKTKLVEKRDLWKNFLFINAVKNMIKSEVKLMKWKRNSLFKSKRRHRKSKKGKKLFVFYYVIK